MANRILNEKGINGDDFVNHGFVKNWVNWEQLMDDNAYLEKMVGYGYIESVPTDKSYESFIAMIGKLYGRYTL